MNTIKLKEIPTFDEDGDPSDQTLETISNFNFDINEHAAFFAFCEKAFNKHYGSWKLIENYQNPEIRQSQPLKALRIATGGWSGNEILINAMQKNLIWHINFVACFRGGLYIFDGRCVE